MDNAEDMNEWQRMIEMAPIGAFRTTREGTFKYANEALATMFGYPSAEDLMSSVKSIASDLLRRPIQRAEVLQLFEAHGEVRNFVYEVRSRNKAVQFVSLSARKIDGATPADYYLEGFMHDITEQKKAESQLNTILLELQGMAYHCNPKPPWQMTWVTEGCRELTGYSKDDLVKQRPAYGDLIWESHTDKVNEEVQKAVEHNTAFTLIYPIRTSQGDMKWVFERGRAVRNEEGKIDYLEGVIQNYNTDQDVYLREHRANELGNERQNQRLRRIMWWTIITQFIVANVVILGSVCFKGTEIHEATLASFFAATVGELAAIVFFMVKYVFPPAPNRPDEWTDNKGTSTGRAQTDSGTTAKRATP